MDEELDKKNIIFLIINERIFLIKIEFKILQFTTNLKLCYIVFYFSYTKM